MKRIVLAVIVAVVLLVAVDFVAAAAAEYRVSATLRTRLALPDDPAVRIDGFPFLAQAVAGDYRRVDVTASHLTIGAMQDVTLSAELYDVRLPLSQVLNRSVNRVTVGSAAGSVTIGKADLMKLPQLAGVTKLGISSVDDPTLDTAFASESTALPGSSVAGVDPDSAVQLTGTMPVLGKAMNVTVIAVLQLSGGQVEVLPKDIRLGSAADAAKLPSAMQALLRDMFTLRLSPGTLPFGVTPTRLRAVGDGLEVTGMAHDITLGGPAPTRAGEE